MSTQGKHTPGPWEHDGDEITSTSGDYIATTAYGVSESQAEANARLIAAAPDLLDALREIAEVPPESGRYREWMERAQRIAESAIAKATGKEAANAS
jgi:hypothetical protein